MQHIWGPEQVLHRWEEEVITGICLVFAKEPSAATWQSFSCKFLLSCATPVSLFSAALNVFTLKTFLDKIILICRVVVHHGLLTPVSNWILLRSRWKHWPLILIYFLILLFPFFASHYLFFSTPSLSPCVFSPPLLLTLFFQSRKEIPRFRIHYWWWSVTAEAPGPWCGAIKVWQSGEPCVLINGAVPVTQHQPMWNPVSYSQSTLLEDNLGLCINTCHWVVRLHLNKRLFSLSVKVGKVLVRLWQKLLRKVIAARNPGHFWAFFCF